MKPVINICSDEELKEAAEQWCKLVHNKIKKDQVNAFMMGAKIAIANNGWVPSFKDEARQLTVDRFTNLTDGLVLPDITPGKVVDYYQNLLDRKDYENDTYRFTCSGTIDQEYLHPYRSRENLRVEVGDGAEGAYSRG